MNLIEQVRIMNHCTNIRGMANFLITFAHFSQHVSLNLNGLLN